MHRRTKSLTFLVLAWVIAFSGGADEMRIVAPYAGVLTNVTDVPGMGEIEDTGFLSGLFFQWIDTERYQWNLFGYYAPDVNYSSTLGGHLLFDLYFGPDWNGKFLAGFGLEILKVDMDAGNALGTDDLVMESRLLIPYLRAGKYFKASAGPADFSILPWVGIQPQWVWGDLFIAFPGPMPPDVNSSLDDSSLYGIAGLNLKVTLFHFVDLEGKYQATFNDSEYFSTYNAMANLYLSRRWGISYRFKFMESSQGSNAFHYFGVVYVF